MIETGPESTVPRAVQIGDPEGREHPLELASHTSIWEDTITGQMSASTLQV